MGEMTGGRVVWGRGLGGNCSSSVKTLDLVALQVSRSSAKYGVSPSATRRLCTSIPQELVACSW